MRSILTCIFFTGIVSLGTYSYCDNEILTLPNAAQEESRSVVPLITDSRFRVQQTSGFIGHDSSYSALFDDETPDEADSPTFAKCCTTEKWFDNINAWVGVDAYKSIGNSNQATPPAMTPGPSWQDNFGTVVGLNTSIPMGALQPRLQVGGSYGVYDLTGRDTVAQNSPGQQFYFTTGISKRSNVACGDRICCGVVYDQFVAEHWGIFASNFYLSQARGLVGYALNQSNEVGVWGTYGINNANLASAGYSISAADQANAYWRHNWEFGGSTMAYVGTARMGGVNSQSQTIICGTQAQAPLSNNFSLYGNFAVTFPSEAPGFTSSNNQVWNASFGIQYSFGGKGASCNISGQQGTPLLPVANNGSFLIRATQ